MSQSPHTHILSQRPCHGTAAAASLSATKTPFPPILLFPLPARLAVIHPVVVVKCTKEQMETETAVKAYRSRFPINKASSPYESSYKLILWPFYTLGIAHKLSSSYSRAHSSWRSEEAFAQRRAK